MSNSITWFMHRGFLRLTLPSTSCRLHEELIILLHQESGFVGEPPAMENRSAKLLQSEVDKTLGTIVLLQTLLHSLGPTQDAIGYTQSKLRS